MDQTLDEIVSNLSPLEVDWMDDIARGAINRLDLFSKKEAYCPSDLVELLSANFEEGILCARLFLALSKDSMESKLRRELGSGGIGVKRFNADPEAFAGALSRLGLLEAMARAINYQPKWSDILVERLRSGRGSAISGQRRGRELEDFAEEVIAEVFGDLYETRCTFNGADSRSAKCDFAIPSRGRPVVVVEVKGYGATGSKMTDIIGDLDAIIQAKRHDTLLMFITDGATWKSRLSDLRKIVDRQNQGKIYRIYTMKMRNALRDDLVKVKLRVDLDI